MNILGTTFAALLNSLWQSAAMALLVWAVLRFLPRMNVQNQRRDALRRVVGGVGGRGAPSDGAPTGDTWQASIAPLRIRRDSGADLARARGRRASSPSGAFPRCRTSSDHGRSRTARHLRDLVRAFSFPDPQIIRSYRYLRGIKQRSRAVSPEQMVNFDYWLLACGIDRTARLLVSSEIVSPMAVGFRRPAVIVPETLLNEFTAEELDHVLLHELAHIARYDDWTNLFARLIGALLPVHPVAVWLIKQIEQEREIACDDWVVAMTGEARPYAASLTRLFELCSARRRQLLATGMADRASHLGERIEALLRAAAISLRASLWYVWRWARRFLSD